MASEKRPVDVALGEGFIINLVRKNTTNRRDNNGKDQRRKVCTGRI